MKHFAKFVAALLGGIAAWGITASSDNTIDMVEWFGLVGVIGTAILVWAVPNESAP